MTITTTDPASTTATVRAEALLVALVAHPGATAFELAATAGMGRSTGGTGSFGAITNACGG